MISFAIFSTALVLVVALVLLADNLGPAIFFGGMIWVVVATGGGWRYVNQPVDCPDPVTCFFGSSDAPPAEDRGGG